MTTPPQANRLKRGVDTAQRFVATRLPWTKHRLGPLRDGVVGTLTLTALLILVYQTELLVAARFGFQTPYAMFTSLPVQAKPVLAATLGPLLHNSDSHIIRNLGVLLLAGAYVEYYSSERLLYAFFLVAGYLAAWFPLIFGATGSLGASGVTYGLQSWMAVYAVASIIVMLADPAHLLDRRIGHIVPLLFGAGTTLSITMSGLGGSLSGAGEATHFLGAIVGLGWGFFVVFYSSSTPRETVLLAE
ncbi:MAG: hypothetical protein ABEJ28_10035 [Salinigranum sp.]